MPTFSSDIVSLPEDIRLTDLLRKTAFFIGIFIGIVSCVSLVGWLANIQILQSAGFNSVGISLLFLSVFILSAVFLLVERKIDNTKKDNITLFYLLSLIASILITGIGLVYLYKTISNGFSTIGLLIDGSQYTWETQFTSGFCMLCLGIAFMLARIHIKYRFYAIHLFALIVLTISTLNIIDYIYQSLSPLRLQFTYLPLNIAILFFLLSIATAFSWPSKGFLGIFTTQAVSAIYTIKILFLNILLVAILGLLSLVGVKAGLYSPFESVAVMAILVMLTATFIAWLNIKLLYKFELERYIIKEELKAHNISLKMGNEVLEKDMEELKKTNKEYVGKLDNRDKYKDIIGEME